MQEKSTAPNPVKLIMKITLAETRLKLKKYSIFSVRHSLNNEVNAIYQMDSIFAQHFIDC